MVRHIFAWLQQVCFVLQCPLCGKSHIHHLPWTSGWQFRTGKQKTEFCGPNTKVLTDTASRFRMQTFIFVR